VAGLGGGLLSISLCRERPVGEIVDYGGLEQPSVFEATSECCSVAPGNVRREAGVCSSGPTPEAIRPSRVDGNIERFWRHQVRRIKQRCRREKKNNPSQTSRTDFIRGRGKNDFRHATRNCGLTLGITEEIHVRASLDRDIAALTRAAGAPQRRDLSAGRADMKLEAWPGGRWFTASWAAKNGHLWGVVQGHFSGRQAEITGAVFMSLSGVSSVAVPLEPERCGTLLIFHHRALG